MITQFWLALIALLLKLDHCSSLTCKIGYATHKLGENATIANCDGTVPNAQHCFSAVCMEENYPSRALLFLHCAPKEDKKECEEAFEKQGNARLNSSKIRCQCAFGERGKDTANAHVKLPPVPSATPPTAQPPTALNTTKRLSCKSGVLDENGFGKSAAMDCTPGAEYCYAVSCETGPKQFTFWGCADNNDCEERSKWLVYGQKCRCEFGTKGENLSNLNAMLPSYLPKSSLGKAVDINLNITQIDHSGRTDAPLFMTCSMFTLGFLTKFILRMMPRTFNA